MNLSTFLRLIQSPAWRHAHGIKMPSIETVFWSMMKSALIIIVTMDLYERAALLDLNHEMRSSISIANRIKQCLEGRRSLGDVIMEDGHPSGILCKIEFVKPIP